MVLETDEVGLQGLGEKKQSENYEEVSDLYIWWFAFCEVTPVVLWNADGSDWEELL